MSQINICLLQPVVHNCADRLTKSWKLDCWGDEIGTPGSLFALSITEDADTLTKLFPFASAACDWGLGEMYREVKETVCCLLGC